MAFYTLLLSTYNCVFRLGDCRGRTHTESSSESVLTMNYNLSLSGYCSICAGHVAEVRATVSDIDTTDGQDANSLCGMGQSFTMGPSIHQAVHLVRRKRL